MKCILSMASPMKSLESYDRYLFVGPHPDDIEIGSGSTAAKLAKMGKTVTFLIALDGLYGLEFVSSGITSTDLIEIRKREAKASALALGVDDVRFLGFSDGAQYENKDLLCAIAKVIGDVNPEVIFAPDPCLSNECHQDHLNVGTVVRQLAFFAPFAPIMQQFGAKSATVEAIAFYYTAQPNTYVKTKSFVELQHKAIFDNHVSQFPKGGPQAKSLAAYLKLRSFFMGFHRLSFHAEGFRMLDRIRMHCITEV